MSCVNIDIGKVEEGDYNSYVEVGTLTVEQHHQCNSGDVCIRVDSRKYIVKASVLIKAVNFIVEE
jgi:hypothetical protein